MYHLPNNIKTPTKETQEYRKGRYVQRSVDKHYIISLFEREVPYMYII